MVELLVSSVRRPKLTSSGPAQTIQPVLVSPDLKQLKPDYLGMNLTINLLFILHNLDICRLSIAIIRYSSQIPL